MGLFDDVVLNAKTAAQNVGKIAGQFVDMSKMRIGLSEVNGEITKRFTELGQFVYEAKKAGDIDEAILNEKLAGIDDLYAQIATVTEQLNTMQNKITCPVCGAKVSQEAQYCSTCGTKIEKPAPVETEECTCGCTEEAPAEEKTEE